MHKFNQVLNDLTDYFILGDISLLNSWKKQNGLKDDLSLEFTTNESGDNAVREGIILPMRGIANYPYTIIFNFLEDKPELLKEENRLQVRQGGYSLKVENNAIMLFTWPVLYNFTDETVQMLFDRKSPLI